VAKLNVFTSYAHEDQKITDALCAMLEDIFGEDIHVFYDKESLHAGEDIDEYPRKPRLFWVRHGHYRGLTYRSQNSKSCKLLTASEMLPVTMGRRSRKS
jgi:hypothetical protein